MICERLFLGLALLIRFLDLWFVEWIIIKSYTERVKSSISWWQAPRVWCLPIIPIYDTYLVLSSTLLSWILGLSHLWSSAYHAQDIVILSSLAQYFTLEIWPSDDCLRYPIPPTEYLSTFHTMSSSTRWRIFSRETKLFRIDFPSDKRSQAYRWITPLFFLFFFLKKMILVTLGGSDMLEQNFLTDGYLHRLFCTPSLKAARPYGWTRLAVVHHGIFHLHSEIGWALSLFA